MMISKIDPSQYYSVLGNYSQDSSDIGLLCCPKCSDRLEPLFLDTSGSGDESVQNIWWTCRGVSIQKCDFPLNMPPEVFWVTRSGLEIKNGVVPVPRLHLLPPNLQYLYPQLYPNSPKPLIRSRHEESPASVSPPTPTPTRKMATPQKIITNLMRKSGHPMKVKTNWDQKLNALFKNVVSSPATASVYRRKMRTKTETEAEPSMNHLVYKSETTFRQVECFPNTKAALVSDAWSSNNEDIQSTMINLKYSHDKFIGNMNSELCRKKMVRPIPPLGQGQRVCRSETQERVGNKLTSFLMEGVKESGRYVYRSAGRKCKLDDQSSKDKVQKKITAAIATLPCKVANRNISARLGFTVSASRSECETPTPTEMSLSTSSSSSSMRSDKSAEPYIKSTGDAEVDALIRAHFRNVLRHKKLRQRGGRNPGSSASSIAPQSPALGPDTPPLSALTPQPPPHQDQPHGDQLSNSTRPGYLSPRRDYPFSNLELDSPDRDLFAEYPTDDVHDDHPLHNDLQQDDQLHRYRQPSESNDPWSSSNFFPEDDPTLPPEYEIGLFANPSEDHFHQL